MTEEVKQMLDLAGANIVEVVIKQNGTVLWVNVDGVCRLRVCRAKDINIEDKRETTTRRRKDD